MTGDIITWSLIGSTVVPALLGAAHALVRKRGTIVKNKHLRPRHPLSARGSQLDYVGATAHVKVLYTTALGQAGLALAKTILQTVEKDYLRLQTLFGITLPSATLVVAPLSSGNDGTGGAYHYSCADATLYCDASYQDPRRTLALFIAELSEVGQATQNKGWDCGATNGEGLSRVHAETLYPGVLNDYETASAWLDGNRTNWVDQNDSTDQDDISNGCAVLFIFWLTAQKGFTMAQVTQAGGSTLAATYQKLTGNTTAWSDFNSAAQKVWPAGKPSGVTVDNPWPTPTQPPPLPPSSPPPLPAPPSSPPPAPEGVVLAPGTYYLPPGAAVSIGAAGTITVGQTT